MARLRFTCRFAQQVPIFQEGIAAALAVKPSGRLHRYNRTPDKVALERDCAACQGVDNSHALQIVLRSAGAGSAKLFDMRLPHAFTMRHCDEIAKFLLAKADRPGLAGVA